MCFHGAANGSKGLDGPSHGICIDLVAQRFGDCLRTGIHFPLQFTGASCGHQQRSAFMVRVLLRFYKTLSYE